MVDLSKFAILKHKKMIQRIQTVWLLLASVLTFALFLFPYLQFAGADGLGQALKVSGTYANVDGLPAGPRIPGCWLRLPS